MPQQPDLIAERRFWRLGARRVAGVDEAGRGAWAGPVVAAAVVLPRCADLRRLLHPTRDSKTLSPAQRDRCFDLVRSIALSVGLGVVPPAEIDALGIAVAAARAMVGAIEALDPAPEALIVDYVRLPQLSLPQHATPKADAYSLSVAAASIVAKVSRDRLMIDLDTRCPGYAFASHKGYGTRAHRRTLHALGPSVHHRRSYAPVRALCGGESSREA